MTSRGAWDAQTRRNQTPRSNCGNEELRVGATYAVPRRPRWFNSFIDPSARNLGQHRSARSYFVNEKEIIRDWTPRDPVQRRQFLKQKALFAAARDPSFLDPELEQGWNGRAGTEASSYNHKVFAYRRFIQHDYRPQAAAALTFRNADAMDPRILPSTWTRGITSSTSFSSSPFARENVAGGDDPLLDIVVEQNTARLTAVAVVNSAVGSHQSMSSTDERGEASTPRTLPPIHRDQTQQPESKTYQPWIPYQPPMTDAPGSPRNPNSVNDPADATEPRFTSRRSPSRKRVVGNPEDGFYSKGATAAMASRALKLLADLERRQVGPGITNAKGR